MKELFDLCNKFFDPPFSYRRFLALGGLLALLFGGLYGYEAYTASFRLSRLQKSADLLVRLHDLETNTVTGSPALQHSMKLLQERAAATIEATPNLPEWRPTKLRFSLDSAWMFLAGSAQWFLFGLLPFGKWKNPEGRKDGEMKLTIAFALGVGATFTPAIWWPWFHLLFYPFLAAAVLLFVITPFFALAHGLANAKKKAEVISCSINLKEAGLAARTWATDHADKLPNSLEEVKPALPQGRRLCCPADKIAQYELLSPGASCTDPNIPYLRCPHHGNVLFADGSVNRPKKRPVLKGESHLQSNHNSANPASVAGSSPECE